MRHTLTFTTMALLLAGCSLTTPERTEVTTPSMWVSPAAAGTTVDPQTLRGWWKGFNDPTLNQLVDLSLSGSPDRKISEARLLEARGLQRSARGALFPQIGASGQAGRGNSANTDVGNMYEAGFDASYELDLFGRNRNTSNAADSNVEARTADYANTSLSLVAEVARTYVQFRAAEKQAAIATKNLNSQQKTLDLVNQQKELGEAPQLDVERAEGLVNTTKSAIPEFRRQADNARLRLTVLTGQLPDAITPILATTAPPVIAEIKPALLTPADVIAARPDIRAAKYDLEAQTSLTEAEIANLFPSITLGAFFGVADNVLIDPTKIWSTAISATITLLDFGRIRGGIDAAEAREAQAYEVWRKTVLQAVTDVETALTNYAHISERLVTLQAAMANAEKSLDLSQQLYKEGEVSFLDVLDAQRTLNNANSSVVGAEEEQAQSLIALYKALGVY